MNIEAGLYDEKWRKDYSWKELLTKGYIKLNLSETIIFSCNKNKIKGNLVFPNNIVTIGEKAFENCIQLKSIIFMDDSKLKYIQDYAFFGCDNLENVILSPNTKKIGKEVFYGCSILKVIKAPYSAKYDSNVFSKKNITIRNNYLNANYIIQQKNISEETMEL